MPAGNCETLASCQGPAAAERSKTMSTGPLTGTAAPPTRVMTAPSAALVPVGVRVTSARKKRGLPVGSGR